MTDGIRLSSTCPACGDVELATDQLWLVLTDRPGRTHYAFWCSGCDGHVRRPANGALVKVLARMVAVERMQIPAEALEPHDGAPLTRDDLIDLMLDLEAAG